MPIWRNIHFKIGNTCLYLKEWMKAGKMYVRDFVTDDLRLLNDTELYNAINNKKMCI